MQDITAIILTKNEEKNVMKCLESIKGFVKRAIVVDSGSTDNTVTVAQQQGAEVYTHEFENYSKQFNWAIDNTGIDTKWTLRIDADERFTEALCSELSNIIENSSSKDVYGITMEALLIFMGKPIKFGGRKKRKLMLFRTGFGRIEDRKMDEHTIISKGKSVVAKEKFIHYDFKDLDFFISKLNWYATREMQDYYDSLDNSNTKNLSDENINKTRNKKNMYYKLPLFLRSWLLFLYFYILKLGFLDGKEGFIYHYMYQRWYRCLVDAKIYEQSVENKPFKKTGDLKY